MHEQINNMMMTTHTTNHMNNKTNDTQTQTNKVQEQHTIYEYNTHNTNNTHTTNITITRTKRIRTNDTQQNATQIGFYSRKYPKQHASRLLIVPLYLSLNTPPNIPKMNVLL